MVVLRSSGWNFWFDPSCFIRHSDIDECMENNVCQCSKCACTNTWGSYECSCAVGFLYIRDYDTCISEFIRLPLLCLNLHNLIRRAWFWCCPSCLLHRYDDNWIEIFMGCCLGHLDRSGSGWCWGISGLQIQIEGISGLFIYVKFDRSNLLMIFEVVRTQK